ncbi:hypothetical protein [Hardygib1 virus]|nr:hypothetical protein [Hardygib1 virus]
MTEGNLSFVLHNESFDDLASILTEYAQMKRVVRQHGEAENAETIRNTLYAQHAHSLK